MAITRLLRIKESSGTKSRHLKHNIFYICRTDKTGGGIWIGGNAGQTPEVIYQSMLHNKKSWNKEDGTQAFHYMLSFPPGEKIDEALAYQITEEFCKELLNDNYYFAFAIHNDRPHLHAHITFDSVSKIDGYKFHSPKGDWKNRIQPITDRLCEKYHLPTLSYSEKEPRGMGYEEWRKTRSDLFNERDIYETKREFYTWNDIIRDDIDEAIRSSNNYEEFLNYLKQEGYGIRDNKYLSLLAPGRSRARRSSRLGIGYGKEEIRKRIQNKVFEPEIKNRMKTYGNREEMREIIFLKMQRQPGFQMSNFQKRFFRRWNNTYFIRKPDRKKDWKNNRKNILEIGRLSDAIRYLLDQDLSTKQEVNRHKDKLQEELSALKLQMQSLRTKLYKTQPYYQLRQYEKLLKMENVPIEKLNELRIEIEAVCPYGEAVFSRDDLSNQISITQKLIKDLKKEIKIVEDINYFLYDMELTQDHSQNQRSSEKLFQEQNDREGEEHGKSTDSYKSGLGRSAKERR